MMAGKEDAETASNAKVKFEYLQKEVEKVVATAHKSADSLAETQGLAGELTVKVRALR